MQWDDSDYAGFSTTKPWLRIGSSSKRVNVEAQKNDPFSHLALYKRLIELRQSEPSLKSGDYVPVHADQQALAYIRKAENSKRFLVVLNLSHRPCYLKIQQTPINGKVVLATSAELEEVSISETIHLAGDEGIIVELID